MFCGQGYNGAGSMAGKRRGVAARIMNKYPKALHTHCASHILNLCIAEATSIMDVRNMMNAAGCVARFFNNSPKRQLAFGKLVDEQYEITGNSSKRINLKIYVKQVGLKGMMLLKHYMNYTYLQCFVWKKSLILDCGLGGPGFEPAHITFFLFDFLGFV